MFQSDVSLISKIFPKLFSKLETAFLGPDARK
ncbi:Uncharacterised protein [Mesomycoplasma hyopneumoniae]|nr:Uncharacterised protein [Mesomycoplasma hyopneumoniae]